MAFPTSADIDTTKLDNDNDSIKDSRAELHKMAGYVNDIITEGPAGLGANQNSIGADDSDPVQLIANTNQSNKPLELFARSSGQSGPSISLTSAGSITISTAGLSNQDVQINGILTVYSRSTTQRAAIPNVRNGMIIYNSTTNKFQGYANGAWVDLH